MKHWLARNRVAFAAFRLSLVMSLFCASWGAYGAALRLGASTDDAFLVALIYTAILVSAIFVDWRNIRSKPRPYFDAYDAPWIREPIEVELPPRSYDRYWQLAQNGGSHTQAEWAALCAAYGERCACCHRKRPLTKDHVIPVSRGGSNDIGNLQPLCQSCNSRKGTRIIDYRNTNTA